MSAYFLGSSVIDDSLENDFEEDLATIEHDRGEPVTREYVFDQFKGSLEEWYRGEVETRAGSRKAGV